LYVGRKTAGSLLLPDNLPRRTIERVEVPLFLIIRTDDDEIAGEQDVPVEIWSTAVKRRVVGPGRFASLAIQRVEASRARTDEQRVTRDRGLDIDSATRIEMPEHLRRSVGRRIVRRLPERSRR